MENINKIIWMLGDEQKKYHKNSTQRAMINVAVLAIDALDAINQCGEHNTDVLNNINKIYKYIEVVMKQK
jgi:hypothetical protein